MGYYNLGKGTEHGHLSGMLMRKGTEEEAKTGHCVWCPLPSYFPLHPACPELERMGADTQQHENLHSVPLFSH